VLTAGIANFLEVFRVVEKNVQQLFNVPQSGVKDLDKSAVLQKVLHWRKVEHSNLESMCILLHHFIAMCPGIQSGW